MSKELLKTINERKWIVTGSIMTVLTSIGAGIFFFIGYLDTSYASAESVENIQQYQQEKFEDFGIKQQTLQQSFDDFQIDAARRDLENRIEEVEDGIYELERRIRFSGTQAREEDRRQLHKLEIRLERHLRELETLTND